MLKKHSGVGGKTVEGEEKQHQHKRDYVSAQSCLAEGPAKKESSSILKRVQLDALGCFLPILASDLHGQFY